MAVGVTPRLLAGGVLSTGFSVLDVVRDGSATEHRAGGTAGNVAANLAWLGIKSALLARVGDDPAGTRFRNDLAASGVDVSWLHRDRTVETPLVLHEVLGHGRHRFRFSCPDCGRRFASHRPAPPEMASLASAAFPSLLFFDRASAGALMIAEAVLAAGAMVMFEPNGLGREHLTRHAMMMASIVKVSGERSRDLLPLLDQGHAGQLQIVTHGAEGLEWRVQGESWKRVPAVATVDARDTGGAGDWTTAAFIASLLQEPRVTKPAIQRALKVGQAFGALSCTFVGARGLSAQCTREQAWNQVTQWTGRSSWVTELQSERKRSRSASTSCVVCLAPVAAR